MKRDEFTDNHLDDFLLLLKRQFEKSCSHGAMESGEDICWPYLDCPACEGIAMIDKICKDLGVTKTEMSK